MSSKLRIGLAVLAAAAIAAGCSTPEQPKPAPAPVETKPAPPPPPPPPPPPAPKAVEAPPPVVVDELNNPSSILAKRSVYFDFDKSALHANDLPIIEAHGKYLVDHRARTIRVEGNCDERGGHEYNLALGQRRADAVKSRLSSLGVAGDRVETVSFGKEKPRNPGHNEAAWAENRRADIVYK